MALGKFWQLVVTTSVVASGSGALAQAAQQEGASQARQNQGSALVNPAPPAKMPPAPNKGPGGAVTSPTYRIGLGDVLQIIVWREPEASVPSVVVRSDGRISVPLVREVEAAGLAPSELEDALTERLSKFILSPEVVVVVKEINSEKAYVVGGGVRKEGPVRLDSPMTVLQVLAQAGGLTDYAKRTKIQVLRNVKQGQMRLPFNYDEVLRGERPQQNILVMPGDTIIVPQ